MDEEGIPGLEIRYTEMDDAKYLKEWLLEPGMLNWFPMANLIEVEDATRRWIAFSKYKCSLTAVYEGKPCGLAALYLMPYQKLSHQCEWGLILSTPYQGKKIGTYLTNEIIHLGKEHFNIELLHLQVYEGNRRAIAFFKKFGFKEFGRQTHWLKDNGEYRGRIFMERFI